MAITTTSTGTELVTGSPTRLSWGAIFGGTLVSLALWILFISLGLALGLTAVDANQPLGFSRGAGIGGGLWFILTGLLSIFVGAFVAARTAGPQDRVSSVLHGAVLWGLSTVAIVLAVWMGVTGLIGTVAGAGKSVVQAAASATSQVSGQGVSQAANALGLDFDDLLAPVNQRLRAEGKPAVTADQLQGATSDAISTGLRQGRLDRDTLVKSIAANTSLSRADTQQLAGRIETTFDQKKDQLVSQVQVGAAKAANVTGKVFWGIFVTLLLSLVSSVLGAVVGVSSRHTVSTGRPFRTPSPTGGPVRTEVYP